MITRSVSFSWVTRGKTTRPFFETWIELAGTFFTLTYPGLPLTRLCRSLMSMGIELTFLHSSVVGPQLMIVSPRMVRGARHLTRVGREASKRDLPNLAQMLPLRMQVTKFTLTRRVKNPRVAVRKLDVKFQGPGQKALEHYGFRGR